MSALTAFTDFLIATRQKMLTSPNELSNQATLYRTYLIPLMFKGLSEKEMVQGGSEIVDHIQLSIQRSFRNYNPTDNFNYTADSSLTQVKAPWRFWMVDSVTYKHEIELNNGTPAEIFKRLKVAKEKRMQQDFWEGMENQLWATPEVATMESTTLTGTGKPYSLRCFITDNGGAPTSSNGGVTGSNWSTVMQVNPTTYTNWKNQFETYDNTSQTTREATFIPAMDLMWLDVQFMSPATSEEHFKSTTLQKLQIVMNKVTHAMLVKLATAKSNILSPANVPGINTDLGWANGRLLYHGLPIKYIGALDSIDTGSDTGTTPKYRCRFINFNHFKWIFHKNNFRNLIRKDGGASNPHAEVLIDDTWGQLWCANRRENGIVVAA